MAGAMDFKRGKFKELVVYLSAASARAADDGFGMVKLNKLLYRADFEAYRLLGHSITGETYEKQEFGPVARDLPIVLDELGAAGRLRWEHIPRGPRIRDVPRVADDPDAVADMSGFSPDEREVIESTLRELAVYGGKDASEWSHEESAGWKAVPEYGQEIDYASAVISTEPFSDDELKRIRNALNDRGVASAG
jgi:Protein of unknown function (DUF4065)